MLIFRGEDVRRTGSGNIGATNVARTSAILGVLTLVLDALKGLAAVLIARAVFPGHSVLSGVAAFFAIVGHVFPVWLRFRGGKGVATGLGSFVVLAPKAVLMMIAVFVATVLMFRYISLGSLVAVALFPVLAWLLDSPRKMPLAFIAMASVLIIAKHHENIHRLLAGTEPQFSWRRN